MFRDYGRWESGTGLVVCSGESPGRRVTWERWRNTATKIGDKMSRLNNTQAQSQRPGTFGRGRRAGEKTQRGHVGGGTRRPWIGVELHSYAQPE